jgi:5'-nucleotidase
MRKEARQKGPHRRLKILLTNDDGIHAPGLAALYRALRGCHDVYVVAPETEMSAVGHAITLKTPLRVQEIETDGGFCGYAVAGTPADCVKIGLQELFDRRPEVVLSGINLGANVGVNILYSGTVSAATEGAFLGVPAVAVSLNTRSEPDFSVAAHFSRYLLRFIMQNPLRPGTALNVNVPALPAEKIRGVAFTRQGTTRLEEYFERRTDPRGNVYYWLAGEKFVENGRSNTDTAALKEHKITITPIHYDLTCEKELTRLLAADPLAWQELLADK